MNVKNKVIIREITKRTLVTNKKRNFFIITAIALTTLMLSSVFSVGMSFIESQRAEQIRLMGTTAHAAVARPSADDLKRLRSLDYVKSVGTGNHVASVINTPQMGDMLLTLYYYDEIQWEEMRLPAYTDITGRYPLSDNEIMAPLWVLGKMGIEPQLNMEVPISYNVETDGEYARHDEVFILSGWFTSYMHIRSGNIDSFLVSEGFSQRHGKSVEADGAAVVIFMSAANVNGYCDRIERDLNIIESNRVRPVPMYDISASESGSTFIALAFITAFLIFMGYLLIYNVLFISVSKDTRFYGLLKTIGTTSRQIRRIVAGQVLRLCVLGIPLGAALAALISLAVVPALISGMSPISTGTVISFSPLIYTGGAIFALLTAFLGAVKPAKTAASVSPIEAQKYTGTETVSNKVQFPTRGKPYRMALRNVFRDRKRAVVVLLSLFLGLTTFIIITTIVTSMDTDNYVNSYVSSDFILNNNTTFMVGGEAEPKQKFNDDFMNAIRNIPGFECMEYRTQDMFLLPYESGFDAYLAQLANLSSDDMEHFKQNGFTSVAVGIDSAALDGFENDLDKAAFERGDFLLFETRDASILADVESVNITSWPDGEMLRIVSAGGFSPYFLFTNSHSAGPTLVMSNTLMNKLTGGAIRSALYIDVAEGYDAEFLDALKTLTDGDYEISRLSRIEAREEMRDAKMMLYVLGGGIAFVLGLIGVLNFINVMSVGVIVRKRELAALESIGMTRRQTRNMLLCEGAGYAVISLVLTAVFGNAATYGVFKLFQQQADYAVFTYPLIPVIIIALLILTVCLVTPATVYRSIIKSSVVERLREAD